MSLDEHLEVSASDDAVEFTLTVTNAGAEPVDLEFRSGKEIDVAVTEDGTEVWRWSDGRMFAQAIRTDVLEAGESMARTVAWENPEAGAYAATATLEAAGVDLAAAASFSV